MNDIQIARVRKYNYLIQHTSKDCAGVCEGDATLDECGVCEGQNITNFSDLWSFDVAVASTSVLCPLRSSEVVSNRSRIKEVVIFKDCNGDCFGTASTDCNDVCNGSAKIDSSDFFSHIDFVCVLLDHLFKPSKTNERQMGPITFH